LKRLREGSFCNLDNDKPFAIDSAKEVRMPCGAIFDFDGVLFHSDLTHETCWRTVSESEHLPFSREQFLKGFGVKNALFVRTILKWADDPQEVARLVQEKERVFQTLVQKEGLLPISGTIDLVMRLTEAKIPCAIGSSAMRTNIDLVMKRHLRLRAAFSVLITGENVTNGKPDPQVFLLAAEKLGLSPSSCVVFEDAPLGVEAGKRAGMSVVALTTSFSRESLENAHPDMIVDSLASVTVQDLVSLARAASSGSGVPAGHREDPQR
jgi:HAD superfamily hydrolase (TIGR01509 family)